MNLSISHDSEVEAFVFPFSFLEDTPALGAIDGNGKTKSLCFYHTKLKILLTLEQERKEEKKKKKKIWYRGRDVGSAKVKKRGCIV